MQVDECVCPDADSFKLGHSTIFPLVCCHAHEIAQAAMLQLPSGDAIAPAAVHVLPRSKVVIAQGRLRALGELPAEERMRAVCSWRRLRLCAVAGDKQGKLALVET